MSVFFFRTKTVGQTPDSTSPAVLYTADPVVFGAQLVFVHVANVSAASAAFTIEWVKSGDVAGTALAYEVDLPANGYATLDLKGFALGRGDAIRFTSSVADALAVTLTLKEAVPRSQG
jgi:hypothetical protein